MTPVLMARGVVAGRPYVLAVGLYGLGVRLLTDRPRRDPVVMAHQPIRTVAEAESVLAVAVNLAPLRWTARPLGSAGQGATDVRP